LKHKDFKEDLMSSIGFSAKALNHLSESDKNDVLKEALETIQKKHEDKFHDELLFRYLLIKGDSLGGSMRNLTGTLAQQLFCESIIKSLESVNKSYEIGKSATSNKIQCIYWDKRVLVFDKTPKFIGNNIDAILLDSPVVADPTSLLKYKETYLACGELKGGIDPAGADEHWKTARSALERIEKAFKNSTSPKLFFLAAAIESAMAGEIYNRLSDKSLSFAANLTKKKQVSALTNWLTKL